MVLKNTKKYTAKITVKIRIRIQNFFENAGSGSVYNVYGSATLVPMQTVYKACYLFSLLFRMVRYLYKITCTGINQTPPLFSLVPVQKLGQ